MFNYDSPLFFIPAIIICMLLILGMCQFANTQLDNVPVKCYVDNELVYSGPSVGIKVESSGDTTQVQVNGGLMYMFPRKYYVSHNVELKGVK